MAGESNSNSVTWKWLVGIFATIITLGGAGWMSNMQAQVTESRKDASSQASDIAVIKEKLRAIEEAQREERQAREKVSQETMKKLDELLRQSSGRH